MVYIIDASGNVLRCIPERIYQGSTETSRLTLIAPYSENTQLSVAFLLTTGESTPRLYMQYIGEIPELSADGTQAYAWRADIPPFVTARYGTVFAQFYASDAQGGLTATARVSFTVERGVKRELPDWPSETSFEQMLSAVAALQSEVKNAAYAARALFAWSSAFTYAHDEIAYCPDAGEHGTFVRSLKEENTVAPYGADGTLNAANWEEVCRFDDVFEQTESAAAAKDMALQYAESAAQAQSAAAQSASDASACLQQVLQLKESASADAEQTAEDRAASAALAESAQQSASDAADAAHEAARTLEELLNQDFAMQEDVYGIINGMQKVGAAEHADSATHATSADNATQAESAEEAEHALTADNATHAASADNATHATSADNATHATSADNATHATSADEADTAESAAHADTADSATHATSADKATRDGNGNIIADTYLTSMEISQTLRYTVQSLTEEQKSQARENIGAVGEDANVLSARQINYESNAVIGKSSLTSVVSGKSYVNCSLQNVTISASGSYYLIHCSGTVTISGTSPTIYITDSPNLTVNGITSSNWRKVYVDGEASYIARNSNITINLNSTVTIGTGIQDNREEKYELLLAIPDNGSHYITGRGGTTYICPNYDKTKTEFIQFTIDSSYNLKCNPQFGESYFIVTWVRFSRKLEA